MDIRKIIGRKKYMSKKIYFRPKDLNAENVVEPPKPANKTIPDWYRNMSPYVLKDNKAFMMPDGQTNFTIKKCPPILDTLISGYMITLPCDVYFADTKEYFYRANWAVDWQVVTTHHSLQVPEMKVPDGYEEHPLKWEGSWEIETPKGYSLLFTHPFQRYDLPFMTMSGIVDSDMFTRSINIPFFIKKDFIGTVPAGTPIAQIIPIKRDSWTHEILKYDSSSMFSWNKLKIKIQNSYKTQYWQKKSYR
jgi:hypothetical protein